MIEENIYSVGQCVFCNETFDGSKINTHLKRHLKDIIKEGTAGISYYLKVEQNPRYGKEPYFLYLWVSSNTKFKKIDNFLRGIWLECCGHMSEFMGAGRRKISKSKTVSDVLYKGLKLDYVYDWGSSTELRLTVIDELMVAADDPITLLSRNERLDIKCDTCKKALAVETCTIHNWGEDCMFCEDCSELHAETCSDFADYAAMPIVNSPRIGICGYTGGSIDVERD